VIHRHIAAIGIAVVATASALHAQGPLVAAGPTRDYFVLVGAESVDKVSLIRFGADGAKVIRDRYVGVNPTELAGPHGIAVSPDKKSYFVTTAHGMPYGRLLKYDVATDEAKGFVQLGNFPATVQVSPDGFYVWAVNFNLHGEMVPSDVSVVAADEMVEIARIPTCTMPHGSRLSPDGTKHYSVCMMDEELVEIDTHTLKVSRHFFLTAGKEMGMEGAPMLRAAPGKAMAPMAGMAGMSGMSHGMEPPKPGDIGCSPTWAQPSPDGTKVWVACNKSSEVVEINAKEWTLSRRIPTGNGVYNLAVTHDGSTIITTNKRDASASLIDVKTGKERAKIPTTRKIASGVAVSDDDRYAFVSIEGTGSQPGTVDIIDLRSGTKVASVDVGQQAGGIDFWKSEPPRPR
jgi:DNA-binding beta-propeller fold protein YncE